MPLAFNTSDSSTTDLSIDDKCDDVMDPDFFDDLPSLVADNDTLHYPWQTSESSWPEAPSSPQTTPPTIYSPMEPSHDYAYCIDDTFHRW